MYSISIIICTRNRASDLRQALESLSQVRVPPTFETELVLADNGSTDETRQVAEAFEVSRLPLRYFFEARPGKAQALNSTALPHARGDILLFTDDDVRVPPDWIEGMSAPIHSGKADAVAGGVQLAPHLRRDWMSAETTNVLATTLGLSPERPERMVGANMAFSRRVLERVPAFDPELGPGARTGIGEETLFTHQLRKAGFTVASAFDVVVEHHCDAERLSRTAYRAAWKKVGRSQAYIDYHWRHAPSNRYRTCVALALRWGQLVSRRVAHPSGLRSSEGIPAWEGELLRRLSYHRQCLKEGRRPRSYVRHGLVKRRGVLPGTPTPVVSASAS